MTGSHLQKTVYYPMTGSYLDKAETPESDIMKGSLF